MNKSISKRSFERLSRLVLTNAIFPERSGWICEYKSGEVVCDTCGNKLVYFVPGGNSIEITNVETMDFHTYTCKGV